MKQKVCGLIAGAVLGMVGHTAAAQELAIGLGATEFAERGVDTATLELDYRHKPFRTWRALDFAIGASAVITGEGDVFAGIGPSTRAQFDNGWFVETRLAAGVYGRGRAENDLGSTVMFRSLLGAGYRFDDGRAVSLAVTHLSNAGLDDINPGLDTLILRYHIPF